MAAGPQEQRLATSLQGARPTAVDGDAKTWDSCGVALDALVLLLESLDERTLDLGGETGPATAASFRLLSKDMVATAKDLRRGASALGKASGVLEDAVDGRLQISQDLPVLDEPTPYIPPVGPPDEEDEREKTRHNGRVKRYNDRITAREDASRKWADKIDAVFGESIEVMKSIHGIPDPTAQPPGAPSSPGTTRPPTPIVFPPITPPPPTDWPKPRDPDDDYPQPDLPDDDGGDDPTWEWPKPDPETPISDPPGGGDDDYTGDPKTPDLPEDGDKLPGPGSAGPAPTPAGAGGFPGGLAAGIGAGAVLGGIGVAAGVKAGVIPGIGAGGQAIGASNRGASSGTLGGRGGAAAGGMGAGRGTGGRGGAAGGRGGRGGRGALGGLMGGRRGKKDRDDEGRNGDQYESDEDWTDDDGAPSVLD